MVTENPNIIIGDGFRIWKSPSGEIFVLNGDASHLLGSLKKDHIKGNLIMTGGDETPESKQEEIERLANERWNRAPMCGFM